MRTPPTSSARLLCYLAITLIVFALAVSIPANAAPGAGFTTFDTALLGCLDSPNGIDCNNYAAKEDVFMNGGPTRLASQTETTSLPYSYQDSRMADFWTALTET